MGAWSATVSFEWSELAHYSLRYEMIVGIPPFYHKNKKKMYYLIKEAPLRFPDPIKHGVSVSDEAKDLITKVRAPAEKGETLQRYL